MTKRVASENISIAPPSKRQMEEMKQRLLQCQFVETAAALVGIPKKVLTTWITLGRQGRSEFVPFVEMLDQANSELAQALIEPIKKAALEDGNLSAAQWLYNVRCKKREDHYMERLLKQEALAEEAFVEAAIGSESEEDIAAAEARALAAAESVEKVH